MSRCDDCGGYGVTIGYDGYPTTCTCDWATEANYRTLIRKAGYAAMFDTSFDGWIFYKITTNDDGSLDVADQHSGRWRSLAYAVVDLVGVQT